MSSHKDDPPSAFRCSKLMTLKKVCFCVKMTDGERFVLLTTGIFLHWKQATSRPNPAQPLSGITHGQTHPCPPPPHMQQDQRGADGFQTLTSVALQRHQFHTYTHLHTRVCSLFDSNRRLFGSKRCRESHLWSEESHLWCLHVSSSRKQPSRWSSYE